MDRYINKNEDYLCDKKDLSVDDLKFVLNPCAMCVRNPTIANCYETCRYMELWKEFLERTEK